MPDDFAFEREKVILEEIKENPDLHHNALIQRIVPKFMAKTTFEKTRDSLVEKNILQVTKKGNKKFYMITENYQKKFLELTERITLENYQYLQHEVQKLKEDYTHKDVDEKISVCIQLLNNLFQTDNGFTILDSIKNPKKTLYKDEHLAIQKLLSIVFELVSSDKDNELIFPEIISCNQVNFSKLFY